MRCEGYTRRGGAFTLGNPQWSQCTNEATVLIEFNQKGDDGKNKLPFCTTCWQKGVESEDIDIINVVPIVDTQEDEP